MAKILVVDDSPTNRTYLMTLLGYGGHSLREASDGAEALALVSADRPDLVITDILMPTMDGYEFVRCLRSATDMAQIPVIFCTAHFRERDARDLARDCGVSHVLTKPCEPESVIRAVDECLHASSAPPSGEVDGNFDRQHVRVLTDKLSGQTGELAAANLRLQALVDISLQLASEKDPTILLESFCGAARQLIAARYSLVGIPSEDGSGLIHLSAAGIPEDRRPITFPANHDLMSRVMRDRLPVRMRNPGGEPTALRLPSSLLKFESLLLTPIVSPSRAYGWLGLFHRVGAVEFSEEDARLSAILAALVGRVYENGKLYAAERLHAIRLEQEIGERKVAQEESAQLADIVNSSGDAIIGMTPGGDMVTWNLGAENIFGYSAEDVRGKPLSFLLGKQQAEAIGEKLAVIGTGQRISVYETTALKRGGGSIEIAVTMSPVLRADGGLSGASAIVRDITQHKLLRKQLLVAQKMEAIGRLSAGVAHDFNNLLTVMGGYSDVLLGARTEQDPEFDDILEIKKAVDRSTALTRQLLSFSKRQITQPRVLDLNEVVDDMDRMLRRVIGEDIDLVALLDPALGKTRADVSQFEQVVMNLAVNARDAMPDGGKLTVQTSNIDLHDSLCVRNSAVPPGSYVMLAITDTGIGMDAATQDRMFEPFFTTKDSGRGTGLGLSTVYGIVEQCGGSIVVYSEVGHGTSFKIFLPRVVSETARNMDPSPAASHPSGGNETLLVVEDEDAVRMLIGRILEQRGYTILKVRNGTEALALCGQHSQTIDLVISDITMPGMNGIDLARELTTIHTGMKVLLMSGYAERAVIHQGTLTPGMPFLEKPFAPQGLARKVREVLDGALPG